MASALTKELAEALAVVQRLEVVGFDPQKANLLILRVEDGGEYPSEATLRHLKAVLAPLGVKAVMAIPTSWLVTAVEAAPRRCAAHPPSGPLARSW